MLEPHWVLKRICCSFEVVGCLHATRCNFLLWPPVWRDWAVLARSFQPPWDAISWTLHKMAIFTQLADKEPAQNANANDNDDTTPRQQKGDQKQPSAPGDFLHSPEKTKLAFKNILKIQTGKRSSEPELIFNFLKCSLIFH